MPTVSVCYALQSVPENINIKKNISPQITLYQYNTQRIYQMFFITHQPETSVSATALYFYMQKPNILQYRYFVFYYHWVDASIKSLKIHKHKENLPRAKLILALLFRSLRLFILYQSFNILQCLVFQLF
jgi:hypothetical protein